MASFSSYSWLSQDLSFTHPSQLLTNANNSICVFYVYKGYNFNITEEIWATSFGLVLWIKEQICKGTQENVIKSEERLNIADNYEFWQLSGGENEERK